MRSCHFMHSSGNAGSPGVQIAPTLFNYYYFIIINYYCLLHLPDGLICQVMRPSWKQKDGYGNTTQP